MARVRVEDAEVVINSSSDILTESRLWNAFVGR